MIRRASTLLALLAVAAPARATVGGPQPVEVLGWEAGTRRVYVHLHEWNAGGGFGTIGYYDLSGAEPTRWRVLDWSAGGGEDSARDPARRQNLALLRRRLVPLAGEPATVLPFRAEVVRADSLEWWSGPVARRRMRVTWDDALFVELDDFRDGVVARTGVWRIPGRTERLWVLAWIADPDEGGYEVQRPMLVRGGERGTRVLVGATGGE